MRAALRSVGYTNTYFVPSQQFSDTIRNVPEIVTRDKRGMKRKKLLGENKNTFKKIREVLEF